MDNEVKQEEVKETPKKSNKTLIIVLSIVGGLVLLGIIGFIVVYNLVIKPVVTVQEETKNKINNILEQGEELQNEIINEVSDQIEDIEKELNTKEETIFTYSEANLNLEIKGTKLDEYFVEDETLYVNGKKISEYVTNSNDTFKIEKVNGLYVLVCQNSGAQMADGRTLYVFDKEGNFIKALPNSTDDANVENTNKGYYCTYEIENNTIKLTCQNGMPHVSCKGDIAAYIYYYNVASNEVKLDHQEVIYEEGDTSEEACN